jgi:OPA family glycerol-3-phosphate transporter-like MFS transporter
MPDWLEKLLPILILLAVVVLVVARLPRVALGHSDAFRRRRALNWLPLGLTYAFLYMGRYNLTVAKNALGELVTKQDFADIFGFGTLVYGCAFVINGPLTDKLGGRATILISALGAGVCNLAMGLALAYGDPAHVVSRYTWLYAANMYFQSFGAVSIVKVNAAWFHVRERGVFGGIFGILISLGIYFAYDWSGLILHAVLPAGSHDVEELRAVSAVFYAPAALLALFAVLDYFFVFDRPSATGHADFDAGDATTDGPRLGVLQVAARMVTNPVIVTIALIEFCSGYLRQAIMQWFPIYAKQVHIDHTFVPANWGMLLCVAGIMGGMFAGTISDHVFGSRRGPVAAVLYAGMLAGAIGACFLLGSPALGWLMVAMSLCIIGVHGMLSGTASMDFAGKHNTGLAVGIIDGFVYLGTAVEAWILGRVLPKDGTPEVAVASHWANWPLVMLPVAAIGLALAIRVWNARPRGAVGGH